jgi:hypothetical protein
MVLLHHKIVIKRILLFQLIFTSLLSTAQLRTNSLFIDVGANISATDCNQYIGFHFGMGYERNYKSGINLGGSFQYDLLRGGPNPIFNSSSTNYYFQSHILRAQFDISYDFSIKKIPKWHISPILSIGFAYSSAHGGNLNEAEIRNHYQIFKPKEFKPILSEEGEIMGIKIRANDFTHTLSFGGNIYYEISKNKFLGIGINFTKGGSDIWDGLNLPTQANTNNDVFLNGTIIYKKLLLKNKRNKRIKL